MDHRLIFATAFAIAACAAYYSIYGLVNIYSGAALAIGIMALLLEGGKLLSVSALHQYGDRLATTTKMYLYVAIIGLMIITSAGVYGFLTSSYQKDALKLKNNETRIVQLQSQRDSFIDRRGEYESQISNILDQFAINKAKNLVEYDKQIADNKLEIDKLNGQIASVPASYVTKRLELQEALQPTINGHRSEIEQLTKAKKELETKLEPTVKITPVKARLEEVTTKLANLDEEVASLQLAKLEIEAHTGPIIYIAEAFGKDVDTAIMWLTLLIVFVFDPLAIVLTIVGNSVLAFKQAEKETENEIQNDSFETETQTPPQKAPTATVPVELQREVPIETQREVEADVIQDEGPIASDIDDRDAVDTSDQDITVDVEEEDEEVQTETDELDEPSPSINDEVKLNDHYNSFINESTRTLNEREVKKLENVIKQKKH